MAEHADRNKDFLERRVSVEVGRNAIASKVVVDCKLIEAAVSELWNVSQC